MKRAMNVQPASFAFRTAPQPVHDPRIVLPDGALPTWQQPAWQQSEANGFVPADRRPVEAPLPAAGTLPEGVAGPPLVISAVQRGELPQDRPQARPTFAAPDLAARSAPVDVVFQASDTIGRGQGLDQFHWRSPPPGLLAALQEGGRARIATLFP